MTEAVDWQLLSTLSSYKHSEDGAINYRFLIYKISIKAKSKSITGGSVYIHSNTARKV